MAKSMRSKWRRKCRAVKRERYGKKELERLKKTLGIDDTTKEEKDAQMKEVEEIVTFTTADKIKEKKKEDNEDMVTDIDMIDIKKKYNTRTLRNENGAYPVWVHPRKRKVTKNKNKVNKKGGKGKGKKN